MAVETGQTCSKPALIAAAVSLGFVNGMTGKSENKHLVQSVSQDPEEFPRLRKKDGILKIYLLY